MRVIVYLVIVLSFLEVTAQQNELKKGSHHLLNEAVNLYQNGNYAASIEYLDRYVDMHTFDAEAQYYMAVNNLKLGRSNGELGLIRFIRKHRNHYLSTNAFFDLGAYYFNKANYANAIKYYDRVNVEELEPSMLDQWCFQKGYAHFQQGQIGQSEQLFNQSIELNGKYYIASNYYLSSIYNDRQAYDQVLTITSTMIEVESPYQEQFVLLHLNALYVTGKWKKIIVIGEERFKNTKSDFTIKLTRFLGEAYFRLNQYADVVRILEKHLRFSGGRIESEAYFMLGKSYFELKNDDLAIKYLNNAGLKNNDYGQLSSYNLGLLYHRSGDKVKSISALSLSAKMDSEPQIQSQSQYLAGKLSYDLKDYIKAIDFLKLFVQNDQISPAEKNEAEELISNAYLLTPDYDLAIAHMEEMSQMTETIKKSYQKVTYKRANTLFNDQQFLKANEMLNKSLNHRVNDEYTSKALFLQGELYYLKGDLEKAERLYLEQINDYPFSKSTNASLYALGYLAYNKGYYNKAENYFHQYVNESSPKNNFYLDGKLRLADSYFVQKKWVEATSTYRDLQQSLPDKQAYLFYRLGQIHNYQRNYESARLNLRNVLNQNGASYKPEAHLVMAETYLSENNFSASIEPLNDLISKYANSPLLPEAYNKRAIAYFNLNSMENARADYLWVLSNAIQSKAAENAIFGLQNLVKAGVQVQGYNELLADFKLKNPNNSNLEQIEFEGAKTAYFNQQYQEASEKLQLFLSQYPLSKSVDEAAYYYADSYYKLNEYQNAIAAFDAVIDHRNIYQSRSFDKKGKALLALGKVDLAIENYRDYLDNAQNEKDAYLANEGLMNAYSRTTAADSTVSFAQRLINSTWQTPGGSQKAYLAQGKAYLNDQEFNKAILRFELAYINNTGVTGAEAMYLKALTQNRLGEYENSNEQLFSYTTIYPGYKQFFDQVYLLIAQNYIALENLFQAKATVKSIIEGTDNEGTIQRANELLEQIELAESKIIMEKDTIKNDSLK